MRREIHGFSHRRWFRRHPASVSITTERPLSVVVFPVVRVTVSVWVFLLEWCRSKLCGIVLHVNREQEFDSLLMMLTNTGGRALQRTGDGGGSVV